MGILDRQSRELINIDGLGIPKYGSLSVRETRNYIAAARLAESPGKGQISEAEANYELQIKAVSILLKRLDPKWTQDQTIADEWTLPIDGEPATFRPDPELINNLFEFFNNEFLRWGEVEQEAKEGTQKKVRAKRGTKST